VLTFNPSRGGRRVFWHFLGKIVKSNHLYGKLMNREITIAIVIALVFSVAVVATTLTTSAYAIQHNFNNQQGTHGGSSLGGSGSSLGQHNGGDASASTTATLITGARGTSID
jgi:hypothetical protein